MTVKFVRMNASDDVRELSSTEEAQEKKDALMEVRQPILEELKEIITSQGKEWNYSLEVLIELWRYFMDRVAYIEIEEKTEKRSRRHIRIRRGLSDESIELALKIGLYWGEVYIYKYSRYLRWGVHLEEKSNVTINTNPHVIGDVENFDVIETALRLALSESVEESIHRLVNSYYNFENRVYCISQRYADEYYVLDKENLDSSIVDDVLSSIYVGIKKGYQIPMENGEKRYPPNMSWTAFRKIADTDAEKNVFELKTMCETFGKEDIRFKVKILRSMSMIFRQRMQRECFIYFLEQLNSPEIPEIQASILRELFTMQVPRGCNIDQIIAISNDSKNHWCHFAIFALGKFPTEQSRKALLFWIDREYEEKYKYEIENAIVSFANIGLPEDLPYLEKWCNTRKRNIKSAASHAKNKIIVRDKYRKEMEQVNCTPDSGQ